MTDRELLELAAKAAGMTYRDDLWNAGHVQNEHGSWNAWNPLTDDGHALRLAVKLQIDLIHFRGHLRADVRDMPDTHELHNGDPYAATRRAIVRAAAEIGKGMAPFPSADEIRENWT